MKEANKNMATTANDTAAPEVEAKKLLDLMKKIVELEAQNDNAGKYSDAEMIRRIAKVIEEEVDCY